MMLTRGVHSWLVALFAAVLLAIYVAAFLPSGIGFFREEAANLLQARSTARLADPSLFPLFLRLFTLVSDGAHWLRVLPALCTAGWLFLTWRLLGRMGASRSDALLLTGITAISPGALFTGTNLVPEALFGLLLTAALLALLHDRALLAGLLAGLATLTLHAGVALVAACVFTLVARRRFRSATLFTGAAMLLVAPWFGWSLAHAARDPSTSVLASLRANEILVVLGRNLMLLLLSPFELLAGISSLYALFGTTIAVLWALTRRRQSVPDLFVLFYCVVSVCRPVPPQRLITPILPLLLWLLWRAFRDIRVGEARTACVVILLLLALRADVMWLSSRTTTPNDWTELTLMFDYLRRNTQSETVIMANLDPVFALGTGRTAIRGFKSNTYALFYGSPSAAITPDQLSASMRANGANYVALTADRGLPEAVAYRKAVEALERGGLLEPLSVAGLNHEYRILRTPDGAKTASRVEGAH